MFFPDLIIRQASEEAVKKIRKFAAKTGDLRSLSTQDIEIIALSYDFIKEEGNVKHLRRRPNKTSNQVGSKGEK